MRVDNCFVRLLKGQKRRGGEDTHKLTEWRGTTTLNSASKLPVKEQMLFRCPSPELGHFCNSLCVCHAMYNSVNQKSKGGQNVSLATAAVCLETLQSSVITPCTLRASQREVLHRLGKKRFNCRAWKDVYSVFQEIRMSSTGLKQLVDLSGNIHKLNSRHVPENSAEQQKWQQKGKGWKETICWPFAGVLNTPLLTHTDHYGHLLASWAVQHFQRYL